MDKDHILKKWKDLSPGDLFTFCADDSKKDGKYTNIFLGWAGAYYTSGWLSAKLFIAETSEIKNSLFQEESYVMLHTRFINENA